MKISAGKKEIIGKVRNFVENQEEIIFAYIFGSFPDNNIFNDLDLAIYIDENSTSPKKIFYEIELSNQLEDIIGIPVDVVVLNKASDSILYRASNGIVIKNSNDNIRVSFITTHWKKYWDFKNKIQEHIEAWK
ncbi:MAG: nucleotidyltransferase domain-containing protein [Deltaproteobacteria bacterium]|nr:nucleotidyltransferase domain-containing protein [Deltaproteobacteria bacterium]